MTSERYEQAMKLITEKALEEVKKRVEYLRENEPEEYNEIMKRGIIETPDGYRPFMDSYMYAWNHEVYAIRGSGGVGIEPDAEVISQLKELGYIVVYPMSQSTEEMTEEYRWQYDDAIKTPLIIDGTEQGTLELLDVIVEQVFYLVPNAPIWPEYNAEKNSKKYTVSEADAERVKEGIDKIREVCNSIPGFKVELTHCGEEHALNSSTDSLELEVASDTPYKSCEKSCFQRAWEATKGSVKKLFEQIRQKLSSEKTRDNGMNNERE